MDKDTSGHALPSRQSCQTQWAHWKLWTVDISPVRFRLWDVGSWKDMSFRTGVTLCEQEGVLWLCCILNGALTSLGCPSWKYWTGVSTPSRYLVGESVSTGKHKYRRGWTLPLQIRETTIRCLLIEAAVFIVFINLKLHWPTATVARLPPACCHPYADTFIQNSVQEW